MFLSHLISAVLAHSQAMAPAETVDGQWLTRLDGEVALADGLSRIGIRCRTLTAVKSNRVLRRPKIDWNANPLTVTLPLVPWMTIDWTRPETPRSASS